MIREATPRDAAGITVVQVRAWRRAYADILPPEAVEPEAVAARKAKWGSILADGPSAGAPTFVWDQDGVVAGFASVGPARDADVAGGVSPGSPHGGPGRHAGGGELRALYVDPPAQGAGVGRALLAAAEERLRADGFAFAVLWVFEENGLARDFYARHGWELEDADVTARHHGAHWWAPAVRYRLAL